MRLKCAVSSKLFSKLVNGGLESIQLLLVKRLKSVSSMFIRVTQRVNDGGFHAQQRAIHALEQERTHVGPWSSRVVEAVGVTYLSFKLIKAL